MFLKRLFLYLVVEAILLGAALIADQWYKGTQPLAEYARDVSTYLAQQRSAAQAWVSQRQAVLQTAFTSAGTVASLTDEASTPGQDFIVLVHSGDSLVFWSSNAFIPARTDLARLAKQQPGQRIQEFPGGFYFVDIQAFGEGTLTTLVPVRYTHEADWGRRKRLFPAAPSIPAQVQISADKTDFPLSIEGQNLAYLTAQDNVQPAWIQWLKLLFYGLALAVLLGMVQMGAREVKQKAGPTAGVAVAAAAVLGLSAWLGMSRFTAGAFGNLAVFAERFAGGAWLGGSVGDWLVQVALWVWFAVFFHREWSAEALRGKAFGLQMAGAVVGYAAVVGSLALALAAVRRLVFAGGIDFDFENILNLGTAGILTLGGLVLLLPGLFLFGHRVLATVAQSGLTRTQRWGTMAGGAVVAYLISAFLVVDFQEEALWVALVGVVYLAGLDGLLGWRLPGFGLAVLWLLVFSFLTALTLYRYNYQKDKSQRLAYAEALAMGRDSLAEPALQRIFSLTKENSQLDSLLKPFPFKPDVEVVRAFFNQRIFRENYLFQHYRLNAFAFTNGSEPLLRNQTGSRAYVDENWNQSQPLPGAPDIRYRTDAEGKFRYLFQLRAQRMGDATQPADIFCFFDQEYPLATRVYANLFFQRPYKNLDRLKTYDYAVLKNDRLVVEQGQGNLNAAKTMLQTGQAREVSSIQPARVDAVYRSADGRTVAAVGHATGGGVKLLYLFSLLFLAASLLVFGAALANRYLRFLPAHYQFAWGTRGSLAQRIHYGYVSLIVVVFFVMAYLTWRHFTTSAEQTERATLDYRAGAMLTNLRTELGDLPPTSDSLRRALPRTLGSLAASLSMDANLYDPTGDLIFSSQPDLAALGILPQKLNPRVLTALRDNTLPEVVETEQSADFQYLTKFLPVRNRQNQLLAYLAVPYQGAERRVGPEVSDFIGALATLYVFLLLIAYVVTFFLTRSIVRPVNMIAQKIRELQLANKNETLEYEGGNEDELSALVDEYNRMVVKLEESKIRMIRLEREGAWREMARQVAHDIKNPLTTMKLSMQQLERVSSDPTQAAAYLKKAITRLIEQIDSLAQIASEFSMFANLEIREKHDMVLNDVVESVYELFSEQGDLDHRLNLPPERMHILGDKNYFIRVLNNLVINAMQAIPSDRRGNIQVSLYRKDNNAVVQISDNGGGIPPEIRERVFEPNFTTKTSGSGLGLAICHKIIEALDGSIHFDTRDNEGTDFFVELPITGVERGERVSRVEVGN